MKLTYEASAMVFSMLVYDGIPLIVHTRFPTDCPNISIDYLWWQIPKVFFQSKSSFTKGFDHLTTPYPRFSKPVAHGCHWHILQEFGRLTAFPLGATSRREFPRIRALKQTSLGCLKHEVGKFGAGFLDFSPCLFLNATNLQCAIWCNWM